MAKRRSIKTKTAIIAAFVVVIGSLCGLSGLLNQQQSQPTPVLTDTLLPTITYTPLPLLTPTNTPIPSTPTPLYGAEPNSLCVPKNNQVDIAEVTRIIDGDTIVVNLNDQEYTLRYIGIDSPENGEAYDPASIYLNSEMVLNKTVYLVKDESDVDSFGRLLRYVFVGETFVNYELVKQGAARVGHWPPDTSCEQTFNEAETAARSFLVGLWAIPPTSEPTAVVIATTEPTVTDRSGVIPIDPASTSAPSANCDPSYPNVCIPPAPPDLDCKDITFRRFQVLPPDPHNFDGDGNGIGCESG